MNYDNYPDDIRNFDYDYRSPFHINPCYNCEFEGDCDLKPSGNCYFERYEQEHG